MTGSLLAHLRFASYRHGWPALVGLLLVPASLLLFWQADEMNEQTQALSQQAAQERQRVQRERAAPPPLDPSVVRALFTDTLPKLSGAGSAVDLIHQSALRHQVELARGEYRLSREGNTPVQRYQITLPAVGTYPAVRAWLADVANQLPTLAIDEVSFSRTSAESTTVEARVRGSLFLRER